MNPDSPVTNLMQQHYLKKSLKESEMAISNDLNRTNFNAIKNFIFNANFLFDTNHGGASWVTELMESMNKSPTILSKFISTTVYISVFI